MTELQSTLETSASHDNQVDRLIVFSEEEKAKEKTASEDEKMPGTLSWSVESQQKRLAFLRKQTGLKLTHISGEASAPEADKLRGNIEQFIGMTSIPTGIVGPLQVEGTFAKGDFYVPMATTEGALVASYNRGAKATKLSGGVYSVCIAEAVQRAPAFKFESLSEAGQFVGWVADKLHIFKEITTQNSRFAQLHDLRINVEGNMVILIFEYTTGEAAGQNMVTICTNAICLFIIENSVVKPQQWYIEGNFSGDKKATVVSLSSVRGKKVTAEATISSKIMASVLKTTASDIQQYWQTSVIGAVQSGGIGLQGHFANGLAAMFLATGQDVACVAEAYVGITRMEIVNKNDLYIAVTLPSLMIGTVGGGTWLPGQRECLDLMGCSGPGSAKKLAEIFGATILAGELSIAAAVASHDFASAHKTFGRKPLLASPKGRDNTKANTH